MANPFDHRWFPRCKIEFGSHLFGKHSHLHISCCQKKPCVLGDIPIALSPRLKQTQVSRWMSWNNRITRDPTHLQDFPVVCFSRFLSFVPTNRPTDTCKCHACASFAVMSGMCHFIKVYLLMFVIVYCRSSRHLPPPSLVTKHRGPIHSKDD